MGCMGLFVEARFAFGGLDVAVELAARCWNFCLLLLMLVIEEKLFEMDDVAVVWLVRLVVGGDVGEFSPPLLLKLFLY